MTLNKVLSTSRFTKLVVDIRKLVEETKARARQVANAEFVRTYWRIGQRIVDEEMTGTANYGESIMEDLADDLDVDVRTLQYCVLFSKTYKTPPQIENLTWSHYKILLGVKDDKERARLEARAEKAAWTRDQLATAVAEDQADPGDGPRKSAASLERPTEATFVYGVVVEDVVDGDTLVLRIDLGFLTWRTQRIRLAGIDAPPIEDEEGREAFEYVRNQLAKASRVMVKTHQIDTYGRYLGHVFYSWDPKADRDEVFEKGRYLNQELLERGLARAL